MYSNTFKDKNVDTARTELLANRQHHDVITFNFHQLMYKGPNLVSKRPLRALVCESVGCLAADVVISQL